MSDSDVTKALVPDQVRYRRDHERLRRGMHEVESDCLQALQDFTSHSLTEQNEAVVLDRTDSKYLLPIQALPSCLQELVQEHTVLQCAEHRIFTYQNTYFDTPGWDLYLLHHNGKLNRCKYRYRRYHETNIAFLETKLKNNKQRTVKHRIPCTDRGPIEALHVAMPLDASLYVNYRRITLWNRASNERLTLDYDLCYRRPEQKLKVNLADFFIVEVKRAGKIYGSPFVRRIKGHGYVPQSFSKYCVGVCLTDDGTLKRNRFKPLLRLLGRSKVTAEVA